MDPRMNSMERRYQNVKAMCQHKLIIPPPPIRRGASEMERSFHKMKVQATLNRANR